MGNITTGLNHAFGEIRVDAQNQHQGVTMISQQLLEIQRRLGTLETEANRTQLAEISALKERCKKMEVENVTAGRTWPVVHEKLEKIPELERELRASKERIEKLEQEAREQREATRLTNQKLLQVNQRVTAIPEMTASLFLDSSLEGGSLSGVFSVLSHELTKQMGKMERQHQHTYVSQK